MVNSCTHHTSWTGPVDRIPLNLPGYIIGTRLRADKALVTLCSMSQHDLDI